MKKMNMNSLLFLLFGIIVGLSVALVAVVVFKNNNETVIIDNRESSENGSIEEQKRKEDSVDDPVTYFTKVDKSSDKGTIKEGFIKIVDFLFYDEPINGVRFSELKDEAKIKIMKIALSIDSKIDSYFPGYKETLSNGTKKIYNDVKLKVVELYVKVTTKICNSNPQLCENAKKDFESLKNSFGLTYEFLKNIGREELNKLKEWYEDFRK